MGRIATDGFDGKTWYGDDRKQWFGLKESVGAGHDHGFRGLRNLGNTCYQNSVMQVQWTADPGALGVGACLPHRTSRTPFLRVFYAVFWCPPPPLILSLSLCR